MFRIYFFKQIYWFKLNLVNITILLGQNLLTGSDKICIETSAGYIGPLLIKYLIN